MMRLKDDLIPGDQNSAWSFPSLVDTGSFRPGCFVRLQRGRDFIGDAQLHGERSSAQMTAPCLPFDPAWTMPRRRPQIHDIPFGDDLRAGVDITQHTT
jgi:hypothetical protein